MSAVVIFICCIHDLTGYSNTNKTYFTPYYLLRSATCIWILNIMHIASRGGDYYSRFHNVCTKNKQYNSFKTTRDVVLHFQTTNSFQNWNMYPVSKYIKHPIRIFQTLVLYFLQYKNTVHLISIYSLCRCFLFTLWTYLGVSATKQISCSGKHFRITCKRSTSKSKGDPLLLEFSNPWMKSWEFRRLNLRDCIGYSWRKVANRSTGQEM